MSTSKPITLALGLGAVVCAAAAVAWWASADRLEFYSGAGVEQVDAAEHDARDILWRAPERLDEPISTSGDEFEASVAPGGPTANNEMFFARVSGSGDTDLYVAERVGRVWSEPAALAALNTLDNEQSPRLSPDGAWLYFASDRPGGEGGLDLWSAPRTDMGWGEPVNLGASVNSHYNDAQPTLDPSDNTLWFASDRPWVPESLAVQGETTTRDEVPLNFDLYSVRRTGGPAAVRDAVLSSPADDVSPAFSPVGDFLYFASSRVGGAGGLDLYRARMTDGAPSPARSLGRPVNTDGDEFDPAPASEGFELFYSTAPPSMDAATSLDLLRTVSREVELGRQTEYGDLAALLRLLPWILLVLAVVLLLAMLRRLIAGGATGASLGALSLMAKCVLVSLILHALLLALLSLWMVEPEAGQLADADSGTRVSLASSTIRSSLEEQVRASAGDPVQVSAEVLPDASTMVPLNVVAAAPERSDVAPVQARSEEAPVSRTANAVATDTAVASQRPAAATPLPAATANESMALQTPAAAAVQRTDEAQTRLADSSLEQINASTAPLPLGQVAAESTSAPAASQSDTASSDRPIERTTPSGSPDAPTSTVVLQDTLPASDVPSLELATPRGEQAEAPAPEAEASVALGAIASAQSSPLEFQADSSLRAARPGVVRREMSSAPSRSLPLPAPAAPSTRTTAPNPIPVPTAALTLPAPAGDTDLADTAQAEPTLTLDPGSPDLKLDTPPDTPFARLSPDNTDTPSPDSARETVEIRRELGALRAPVPDRALASYAPKIASVRTAMPDLRIPIEVPIPAEPEPDTLTGTVLDAVTSAPIAGAQIRLDLLEAADASANSGTDGAFVLRAFDIPDNAAISASAKGYIPYSANITADELEEGATTVILLWPESRLTVALEDDPAVHHLGNDAFTGRVNSQFQRQAEGLTLELPFALSAEQLPPNTAGATLLMLAKGVQLENRFYINGRRLDTTFPESPSNGSFGEIAVELPIRLFREGFNTLGIESIRRGDTDYDDFEFVNARIQFIPANVVID